MSDLEEKSFIGDFLTLGKFIYTKKKLIDFDPYIHPETQLRMVKIIDVMDNLPLHYRRFIELFESTNIETVIRSFANKWLMRYNAFESQVIKNQGYYYYKYAHQTLSVSDDPILFILYKLDHKLLHGTTNKSVIEIIIDICKDYKIPDRHRYINDRLIFALHPQLVCEPLEKIIPHILEQGFRYGLYTHHTEYLTECVVKNEHVLRRQEPMHVKISDLNNCLPIGLKKKGLAKIYEY